MPEVVMTKVFNIPNSLTMLRMVLIPAFVIALEYERFDIALYIFIVASVSDSLDGIFARLKDQRTELGAILDPVADKFMLVTSFILYAYYGWVPEWLTIIVISRDLIVVSGWMAIYFSANRIRLAPSWLGKSAIFTQFTTICYVLINKNFGFLPFLYWPLIYLTAVLVTISGIHYFYREMKIASER
jgi:cardiolipin synthase